MRILSKNIKTKWKNYVSQSLAAGISILILVVIFTNSPIDLILIAAAGSTAFTVFALPYNRTAKARNAVWGHGICVAVGLACSFSLSIWMASPPFLWISLGVVEKVC